VRPGWSARGPRSSGTCPAQSPEERQHHLPKRNCGKTLEGDHSLTRKSNLHDRPVTVCRGPSNCPRVNADRREDWQVTDPRDLPADQVHTVRNENEQPVLELPATL